MSASRPDQVKLVGQLNFDLAEVLNYTSKRIEGCRKLSYCSVEAELMFDIKVNEIRKSEKLLGELDKSTFKYFDMIMQHVVLFNPTLLQSKWQVEV